MQADRVIQKVKLQNMELSPRESNTLGQYRGVAGDVRAAGRRAQLLEAGLATFGTHGFAKTSVKAICATAGLSERYFYESFANREDLLYAVYESIVEELTTAMFTAVGQADRTFTARAHAALTVFFGLLTDDARKGRVLSVEAVGVNDKLEKRRFDTIHVFADFLAAEARELASSDEEPALDPLLTSLSLVGAANELLIEWLLGRVTDEPATLVEHCTRMFVAVGSAAYGSEN